MVVTMSHVTELMIEQRRQRGDNDVYSLYEFVLDSAGIVALDEDGQPVVTKVGSRRIKHKRVGILLHTLMTLT